MLRSTGRGVSILIDAIHAISHTYGRTRVAWVVDIKLHVLCAKQSARETRSTRGFGGAFITETYNE